LYFYGNHRKGTAKGGVVNGISSGHQAFLNAGLYGFIIGDGKLNYGKEGILELYYRAQLANSLWQHSITSL